MRRRRSFQVTQRDAGLLPPIQPRKAEHPFWGYRRLWAYLHLVEQLPVHKQRLLRLMREHHLLVPPHLRLQAKRTPMARKPRPNGVRSSWLLSCLLHHENLYYLCKTQ